MLKFLALRRTNWPFPAAAIDLDFVKQRYWFDGQVKATADFTSYTLDGSTFSAVGLTPTSTIDWTLTLLGHGTFVPGTIAAAVYTTSAPAAVRQWCQLDDGTAGDRCVVAQSTSPGTSMQVFDGSVSQAAATGAGSGVLNKRHGVAFSFATDDVKFAGNGTAGTADVSATMPTVTTLRIGKGTAANSQPLGSIARLLLFTAVKTQDELTALSIVMRDSS